MRSSFTCLQPDELKKFIAGDISPKRVDEVEDHLSTCDVCRCSLEATVGDRDWWKDLQSALRPDTGDYEYENSEPREAVCQRLTALLGPTDYPSMLGRIGSYEVIGLLGYGGMGAVFKAHDPGLNRYVAIKILLPHLALSGASRARFRREGQAAAAIIDDCVLPIHAVDEWQGIPYLVMQYTRGVSLQKRIHDRGPLELKEVLRIGLQAARGLAAAHAQGLVHRDVKPSNILLDGSVDRALLTDFGLARAVDDASLTASGIIAGTPQYMSPEQARAETVDHRSDLFSLGSVMYAMCTGHAPFRAESSYSVLHLITDKEPRPIREVNPDVPEWLCSIINKLMAKQASERFDSAKQVAALLEDCLAHVQQPASAPLPASLVPHTHGRRSVFYATRTGVMTMIGPIGLTLLGIVLWQSTEPPDISGQWTSEEWGTVVLEAKESGHYVGTLSKASFALGELPDSHPHWNGAKCASCHEGSAGKVELKWSRLEHRFNGTWTQPEYLKGKLSVRLTDNEIRGAWTTSGKSRANPGTPRLGDLTWTRTRDLAPNRADATPAPVHSSVTTTEKNFWGMLFGQAAESPVFNRQQTTNHAEVTPAPVISNVTIADKTATVSGMGGDDLDCVLRIGKSKKNAQLEWTTPVTGQFTATITASDRMPSGNGKLTKGIVLTVQNAKSSNISNIGMSDSDPVPAGEVRFRQQSAMDRADSFWTFADIYCDDGTTIPISVLLRANKPLLPPGPIVYEGKVQEWVGGDRDGPTLPSGNYKPVPSATLQLYRVSPIIKGSSGYQFEEIAAFQTDKEGHFKISIPDDLKRFIPTPHTKEWDEWESLLLITTSAPGFATDSITLAANRGLPLIVLARGTSINGRLVDEHGKPVVGAQVTVNQQSRSRVKEMDEWLSKTSSELLPAAKFDSADTAAILAARTNASIANHSMHWIPTMIEGVITDQEGRFTIDGIGPDDVLDLTVEALGYNDASIKVIGRDSKTVYSRDPFGSGDNIAVHGRNFQVSLAASDRGSLHTRHRIIKGERTKGPNESATTGEKVNGKR